MHEKMMKMMAGKRKERDMSPEEKAAKMSVLHELRGQAMDAMKDGLKSKKASAKPEGLSEGIDKVKELAGDSEGAKKACEECGEMDCMEHGPDIDGEAKHDYAEQEETPEAKAFAGEETPEEEDLEDETLTPEEIDHKIAKLEAIKAKKQAKPTT